MTTTDRLAEIETRLSAATPGPWEHVERQFDAGRIREHSVETHHHVIADDLSLNSAELIAHAPTDLAALVAVVREVEALHQPFETTIDFRDVTSCSHCLETGNAPDETPWDYRWPCPTAAALQKLGGAS